MVELKTFHGPEVAKHIRALAELRISVFKDWPYLYDGSADYESRYLQNFFSSQHSVLVLAKDNEKIIGASTGLPLMEAEHDFRMPFVQAGLGPHNYFYFGESVLLRPYRGQGFGKKFFEARENFARSLGFVNATFCAVERNNHPAKPNGYVPLDSFWQTQGFLKQNDLRCEFSWKDIGQNTETKKIMVFWTKKL